MSPKMNTYLVQFIDKTGITKGSVLIMAPTQAKALIMVRDNRKLFEKYFELPPYKTVMILVGKS